MERAAAEQVVADLIRDRVHPDWCPKPLPEQIKEAEKELKKNRDIVACYVGARMQAEDYPRRDYAKSEYRRLKKTIEELKKLDALTSDEYYGNE